MSRMISELLGASEPMFSINLQQLERASANPAADVYLTAEIIAKVQQKKRELGLDPKDTNANELYHGLKGLIKLHDSFLAKRLGIKDAADVKEVLTCIQRFAPNLPVPQNVWVLKHSVAKRLLKAMPPKKVMKQLHYRSVDSMLKREPVAELFGSLRFAESPDWLQKFTKQYAKLRPSDFEVRPIEIIYYDPKKWAGMADVFVERTKQTVSHLKELGAVLLVPLPINKLPGITITTLPFVLNSMAEIREYSAYFKLQQVKPDFGQIITNTLLEEQAHHILVGGQHMHWRVVHKHFGRSKESFTQVFSAFLSIDDVHYSAVEETLYKIEPALHFWHEMNYVGVKIGDGLPVSFNLLDMAISYVNNLNYGYHSVRYMRSDLWDELLTRYLAQTPLEQQALRQLQYEQTDTLAIELAVGEF